MDILLFIAILVGYIIPAISVIFYSIACIFSYRLAQEYSIFTYGKVLFGIIIGLAPLINAAVFATVIAERVRAPNWWWFHRNVDTRKYR